MNRIPRHSILSLALFALTFAPSQAAAGPPGFAFLEVPAGARASALGGAYVSLCEGVESAFWNPAGLAAVHGIQVVGSHVEFLQSLRHDQFAVAGRLLGGGTSAGIRAMYSEAIVERDEVGNEVGSFGGHDLEFSLGYGLAAGQAWRIGGSAQVLRERIAESAATTMAFGAGTTWEPLPSLKAGLSLEHLGPAARYRIGGERGQPVPLPMAGQAGVSYGFGSPMAVGGHVALEARLTRGESGVAMVGGEITHPVGAALRLGVRAGDRIAPVSYGVGWKLPTVRLDYAFVPYKLDLGDTHRLSFVAQF